MKLDYAHPEYLVSTQWLAEHLGGADLRIVDATYKARGVSPTAAEDYRARHIPGAVFFDIEAIADPNTDLPHMLPSPALFAERASELGISNETQVVVYDAAGLTSAGRVWWTLRVFGHRNVALLNGGLKRWMHEGREVAAGEVAIPRGHFVPSFDLAQVRDKEQMRSNIGTHVEQVIDARPAGRFEGTATELWPGRRSGHIPGSLNLPSDHLTDPETGLLLPPEVLRARFDSAALDFGKPVIASCGSGVTAAALAFGLHLLGHPAVAVYDGSWAEWGLPGDTPVATGPANASKDNK